AKRNLSTLFTQDFVKKFLLHCYDVDNEQEFDDVWEVMLRECFPSYGPTGHQWCKYIRRFQEQWSSAWVRNHYTAGMVSTQLVESTNAVLLGFLQTDHNLVEFSPNFDWMVCSRREVERQEEFKARNTKSWVVFE
ncbi:hypothetical protein LINPERPRIM_LOCUS31359, partial [Linum perenne]